MGVVTKRPIKKGDKLSIENVRFAFPNKGIGVENWEYVNGATFNHALDAGMSVVWNDIQLYSKT
jgi:sialic acid synthase SpsE